MFIMADGDGNEVVGQDFWLRSYQNEMVEESFHRNVIVAVRKPSYTLKTMKRGLTSIDGDWQWQDPYVSTSTTSDLALLLTHT
jgi:hypothetical protein